MDFFTTLGPLLEKEALKNLLHNSHGPVDRAHSNMDGNPNRILVFNAPAWNQLRAYIQWGKHVPANSIEQGGILCGKYWYNSQADQIVTVVNRIIPAIGAMGSKAYLKFDSICWHGMLSQLDGANAKLSHHPREKLIVIGWFHTHPENLEVFMSGVDRATQRRFFDEDWLFSVVLNPQKQIWCAYNGAKSNPACGYALTQI